MSHPSEKATTLELHDSVAEKDITFEHSTPQPTEVTSGSDIDYSDNENCKSACMQACLMSSVVPPAYKHEDMNPTEFYQNIYLKCDPGDNPKEFNIYVRHKPRLQKWKYSIKSGVSTINSHAPGLKLKISEEKSTSDIIIFPVEDNCYTRIFADGKSHVNFPLNLDKKHHMDSIVLHEFLHALGFQHEHQRRDGRKYIIYGEVSHLDKKEEEWMKHSIEPKEDFIPITAYDPYSIIHYPVSPESNMEHHDGEGPPEGVQNIALTELDKIGLNMVYPPARSPVYNPIKCQDSGMYYCGRQFKIGIASDRELTCTAGGPNCFACRVLCPPCRMREDQWQGKSGWVYCGKEECGPHSGTPCDDCRRVIDLNWE